MRRPIFAALAALASLPALAAASQPPLDLATLMGDPDWIGHAVESPYWSVDGQALYYRLKRDGSQVRDLYRVDLADGTPRKLDPAARGRASGPAVFDPAHRHAAWVRHGDVFVRDLATGATRQVTQTAQEESDPRFSADGRLLTFRAGNDWYRYALDAGVVAPVAILKFKENPASAGRDALGEEQLRLFPTLRRIRADHDADRADSQALAAADPGRLGEPFWLGEQRVPVDSALSPDGHWLLLVTRDKDYQPGEAPKVMHYVTDTGYAKAEDARVYVGRNTPAPESLLLLDLDAHKIWPLDTASLPGIGEDPLATLRARAIERLKRAGKADAAKALAAPAVRPVRIDQDSGPGIAWSADGRQLAIELRAIDNKDRWIASVDFKRHALVSQDRLHDAAWINWNFNDLGWLKDNRTLWFLSERSGFSQLYAKPLNGPARALTSGHFEVSHPALSPDGRWFYLRANRAAPYAYDIYRVPAGGGPLRQVTQWRAMDDFVLSPDGQRLAVLHSSAYRLPQLAVQPAAGGASRELTHTTRAAFKAHAWIEPKIVGVPSQHGAGTIWAKYYGPREEGGASRPAVIFVHGAGYLQNTTAGWPAYYFREQLFHNLLVQQGYVVLDMDYRASEGYGRDWRTAIYRQMGHPELEDLLDGKAWLVAHHHVDPRRVGIYGGSYGGFMTEMALLRAPGAFAAGAALRPVSDWLLYNDEYTSNILNAPQLDPEAYTTSSPIEYADRLADPLLIAHGLIDDNVVPTDSIRMYERLVELHKKDFWISLYPLERHGFVHPAAWYDEYRRIDELFERYVHPHR